MGAVAGGGAKGICNRYLQKVSICNMVLCISYSSALCNPDIFSDNTKVSKVHSLSVSIFRGLATWAARIVHAP